MVAGVFKKIIGTAFSLFLAATVLLTGAYFYVAPEMPSVTDLKNIRLQTPLRIYARDGQLLGEFGEQRRIPVAMSEVPSLMINAFLAAEDDRFFEHPGVDYAGLLRATMKLIETGEKKQGGSTITMQLARNYFLTSERTYKRKIKEIFLALLIEKNFSKNEILELYLNKIFLGQRAYGVGAAADVYYGVAVQDLNLAQIAMIAGLPKAPSVYNPLRDPPLSLKRRNYVLNRMLELKMIEATTHTAATMAPVTAKWHDAIIEVDAPYVAEMARLEAIERFGYNAYTDGYEIHTTVESDLQAQANKSIRKALGEYDTRHGYRGAEKHFGADVLTDSELLETTLDQIKEAGGLMPAIVTEVHDKTFEVLIKGAGKATIELAGYSWAHRYIDQDKYGPAPQSADEVVSVGDLVRVEKQDAGWQLGQLPKVNGAIVALAADSGAIVALSGGLDFSLSNFNRAIQAKRQPGSAFKPFIYSAALAHGYTPASIVNDAPVVFTDFRTRLDWRPVNYSGKFFGPTRLREALKHSRNLVSIRLVDSLSVRNTLDYIMRFGFDRSDQPYNLTLALGSGAVTPLGLASGFTTFANGGVRVEPYLVDTIRQAEKTIYAAQTPRICAEGCDQKISDALDAAVRLEATAASTATTSGYARRTIPSGVAYQISSMLQDAIRGGTGQRALALKRSDLAGKTGTTNDQHDAWFVGFNRDIVTVSWVGFDDHQPLGRYETGSRAALPMWIEFMKAALDNKEERSYFKPPNIVTARIDPETGMLAHPMDEDSVIESFRDEYLPKDISSGASDNKQQEQQPEKLF